MKKKILTVILTLCLAVGTMTVMAFAEIASGNGWVLDDDGTLTISSDAGMIDWTNNGRKTYADSVESIVISDGVTYIAYEAFAECLNVTTVTVPSTVITIEQDAFTYCSGLESVIFESGSQLTSIGQGAFFDCTSLKSITIPSSVTTIDRDAFIYCSSLESVIFEDGCQLTIISQGTFYGCNVLKSITIPSSVTTIGQDAFMYCLNLESVTFEDGSKLTSIGQGAFYDCYALKSITIPSSVTSIGKSAFDACESLESVVFEDGINLSTIEEATFSGCSKLTSISIPSTVTAIGSSAFEYCSSLESITIPDGVTSIEDSTFGYCTSLTSIVIPSSVTSVDRTAFYMGHNVSGIISDVYYAGTLAEWESITIGEGNDNLAEAFIHCNSTSAHEGYTLESAFTWNEDHTSCELTLTCSECGSVKTTADCDISIETTEATCCETGLTTYIATATIDSATYSDTKTETIPTTGHS